jgi:hypothetical protein
MKALRKNRYSKTQAFLQIKKNLYELKFMGWKEDMSGEKRMYGSPNLIVFSPLMLCDERIVACISQTTYFKTRYVMMTFLNDSWLLMKP